jgi:xylan 1,4-beta-xylosidase
MDNMKLDRIDLLKCYSFWTFSDIFEESGFSSVPYHGGFGLLNIHGIPKPSYRAFQMLSKLNGDKLEAAADKENTTVDCTASRNSEGITVLLTNHNVPKSPINAEKVSILLRGLKNVQSVSLQRIDETHSNPKRAWVEMGSPTYLDNEQIQALIDAAELKNETVDWSVEEEGVKMELTIQPHSAVAITIR